MRDHPVRGKGPQDRVLQVERVDLRSDEQDRRRREVAHGVHGITNGLASSQTGQCP